MDVDSLDLLQFHWWDYRDKNYLDALYFLGELQQEGKIKHLALTNFDTEHLKIILSAGIKIVSNQVQFSLIDRRPLAKMAQFCQEHNIYLLAYGTLAGGLLGAKYLGHPEPNAMSLNTASLRKYKNMINAWGNWQLFQELLTEQLLGCVWVLLNISKKMPVFSIFNYPPKTIKKLIMSCKNPRIYCS
jgi:aryl-alcohol dehydrogenase-like predicted oxidoreductase